MTLTASAGADSGGVGEGRAGRGGGLFSCCSCLFALLLSSSEAEHNAVLASFCDGAVEARVVV